MLKNQKAEQEVELFVHGMHPRTTKKDIREYFSQFANIRGIKFKTKFGKHKGYAFLKIVGHETAKKIISKRHFLNGRWISCELKYTKKEEELKNKQKRVFIAGLPWNAKDEELTAFFEKFGPVKAAYSIKNELGESRGFGFVDFKNIETADQMKKIVVLDYGGKIIYVKPYRYKENRRDPSKTTLEKNFVDNNLEIYPQNSSPRLDESVKETEYPALNKVNDTELDIDSSLNYDKTSTMNYDKILLFKNKGPLSCFMNRSGEFLWEISHQIGTLRNLGMFRQAQAMEKNFNFYCALFIRNGYVERSVSERIDLV